MDQYDIIKSEFLKLAQQDENVYFVITDGLENILFSELRQKFPERVIQTGISECNSIGFSSGLALQGKTVFVCIPAIFASTRAFEQIRVDMAYNSANVKLLAVKSGIKFNSEGGYSHWGIEDIALMRTLPNLRILAPATMSDVKSAISTAYNEKGPVYIRLENAHSDFDYVEVKTKHPSCAILATGAMVEDTLKYKNILEHLGIRISVVNITRLKPFDNSIVIQLLKKSVPIITLEEHCEGGLSGIVSELIATSRYKTKFLPLYFNTNKVNLVGNREFIMQELLGSTSSVLSQIWNICKKPFFYKLGLLRISFSDTANKKTEIKYKLLSIIPLFQITTDNNKIKYRLFGIQLFNKRRK